MKLSLPIYLLIGDTLACVTVKDYKSKWESKRRYEARQHWKYTTGSYHDIDVVRSCTYRYVGSGPHKSEQCEPNSHYLKITNTSDKSISIQIPINGLDDSDLKCECDIEFHTQSKYSSVGITNDATEEEKRASALLMPYYQETPAESWESWVYAYSPRQKRNVNDCYNIDGCAKWKEVPLVESSDHVYKDLKVQLIREFGRANIYQKSESLLDFQCNAFKTDADLYLSIQIDAKDEYAKIKSKVFTKLEKCQTKLNQYQTSVDYQASRYTDLFTLAETDFSVKNSALNNEFSVKNSTFDARDIVDSVLVGLIAVLTSVAVYQYKGIETLKRVANGSDYQKM